MRNSKRRFVISLAILLFYVSIVHAQSLLPKFEIGFGISGFVYQGDLTIHRLGSIETIRPGINLQGSYILNRSYSLRTNLAMGGLRADDAVYNNPEFRKQRAFNFRTPVIELSQLIVWNPLGTNYKEKGISTYLFAGAGLSLLNINRDATNFNPVYFGDGSDLPARLAEDEAHSLPRIIPVIPLGGGIRYNISPAFAVNAESTYRLMYTDYLDGFSKAANPAQNDHYQTITVGGIYRIGNKSKLACPVVRY